MEMMFQNGVYKEYIHKYQYFGHYIDSDKNDIQIVSVWLRRNSSRDRARVMQRNFAADIISGKVYGTHPGKAALIAFYGDDPDDWRLSFVKVDTELVCNEKKVCVTKTLLRQEMIIFSWNPEPVHCMKRFCPLIQGTNKLPTLAQLEEVFHVEAVTSLFLRSIRHVILELTLLSEN